MTLHPRPLFFTLLMLSSGLPGAFASDAPPKTVPLWPAEPPGSIHADAYREEIEYLGKNQSQPRISKVVQPTLEILLPEKAKANGTAVIVCPGGGYSRLAYDYEGVEVAEFFNDLGIAAFVLKYRLPSSEIMQDKSVGPLQDAQEALRTVRRRASEWGIDPAKIGIMGFSAGGHLAASASTLYQMPVYPSADTTSARPDFSILVYPVITMQADLTHAGSRNNLLGPTPDPARVATFSLDLQVNERTPPTFLVHSVDDKTVPVENSVQYFLAAKKHGVPVEFHAYPTGGHGYGLGKGQPGKPQAWTETLKVWLRERSLL